MGFGGGSSLDQLSEVSKRYINPNHNTKVNQERQRFVIINNQQQP